MGKLIMRKLNNTSGKSIFMALLLLLVAVVVSVVIVTVAITSVMHVQDNKTSQQEYLACASAADLIKDCVAGSTYTYTNKTGTRYYKNKIGKGEKEFTVNEPESYTETSEVTTARGMKNFVTRVSRAIRENTLSTATGKFKIEQTEVNGTNPVNAEWKITYDTNSEKYNLKIYLSYQKADSTNGYRMNMSIPISVEKDSITGTEPHKCTLSIETINKLYLSTHSDYRSVHSSLKRDGYAYELGRKNHNDFNLSGTTTTITWQGASTTGIKISKGAEGYEN